MDHNGPINGPVGGDELPSPDPSAAPAVEEEVSYNLNGQKLGRKGRYTRDRILAATVDLLSDAEGEAISMSAARIADGRRPIQSARAVPRKAKTVTIVVIARTGQASPGLSSACACRSAASRSARANSSPRPPRWISI